MASLSADQTLILPPAGRRGSQSSQSTTGLPADLLRESVVRLRILALLYAFVFFMSAFFPVLMLPADRAQVFSRLASWLPGVIAIAMALAVAALTWSARVSLPAIMGIGHAFEVASSYGIAAAEFLDPNLLSPETRLIGLSWVGVWVLLYTVVVPTSPRRAVLAALAAVSSVPVTVGYVMLSNPARHGPTAAQFFFGLVFPYLLVVVMAYVGARVVYALGAEIKRSRELGSYRLVERLGEGGMGEVWRAEHRMLARPAAIKLIRPALSGGASFGSPAEFRHRFEREAQAIASLRSPHTVDLFDFGVAADGAFYYVMELLDGLDAETLVRRHGKMPFARVIYVLRQVCHSLSEAEAHRLVHRDIKPANIFLCRYGEEFDFVKVLDFGLVKALGDKPDALPNLTREHSVHGTPAFIAPEQALGLAELDGRADIYSTGCVAFWLLTGELVFRGETPMELLMHHAHTAPVAPSTRITAPIPAALDQLILACLAKNPADRPQSAKELSRRLAEIENADRWTNDVAREWWASHERGVDRTVSDPITR
jgi:serine/threonine-protein kinase